MTREELEAALAECEGHTPEVKVGCPFCGVFITKIAKDHMDRLVAVECDFCGATGPWRLTDSEAIKAWNSRGGNTENGKKITFKEIRRMENPLDTALNEGDGSYKP